MSLFQPVEKKIVLDNGLIALISSDWNTSLVAVNMSYHVGSKNDPVDCHGIAHFYEHLMFEGTSTLPGNYVRQLERVGAVGANATTTRDYTTYFQAVPRSSIEFVLFAEADRMRSLASSVTESSIEEQRNVIRNEIMQAENRPFGSIPNLIARYTYPSFHPYSWPVKGEISDLPNINANHLKTWGSMYCGPSNAVLSIVGPVEFDITQQQIHEYFADIPPCPPTRAAIPAVFRSTGDRSMRIAVRAPHAQYRRAWNVPGFAFEGAAILELAARYLAGGNGSLLFQEMNEDGVPATEISSRVSIGELEGQLEIIVDVESAGHFPQIRSSIDAQIDLFLRNGPIPNRLESAKEMHRADRLRRLERAAGWEGQAHVLAVGQMLADDPSWYLSQLRSITDATAESVRQLCSRSLTSGAFSLEIEPQDWKAKSTAIVVPWCPDVSPILHPAIEEGKLSNGLRVMVVEDRKLPVVNCWLNVSAGYSLDPTNMSGLARLSLAILRASPSSDDPRPVWSQLERFGSQLVLASTLDISTLFVSAQRKYCSESIKLLSQLIRDYTVVSETFRQEKTAQASAIRRELMDVRLLPLRSMPLLLFGNHHAYGMPFSGSGFLDTLQNLDIEDVQTFLEQRLRPDNAQLIFTGDISINQALEMAQEHFDSWQPQVKKMKCDLSAASTRSNGGVHLVNHAGGGQSTIAMGMLLPAPSATSDPSIAVLTTTLAGDFASRVNSNLRERNNWSYGVRAGIVPARGPRLFLLVCSVSRDRTRDSIDEIRNELCNLAGSKPITNQELASAKKRLLLERIRQYETPASIGDLITLTLQAGFDLGPLLTYREDLQAVSGESVTRTANEYLGLDRIAWVIIGDQEYLRDELKNERTLSLAPSFADSGWHEHLATSRAG